MPNEYFYFRMQEILFILPKHWNIITGFLFVEALWLQRCGCVGMSECYLAIALCTVVCTNYMLQTYLHKLDKPTVQFIAFVMRCGFFECLIHWFCDLVKLKFSECRRNLLHVGVRRMQEVQRQYFSECIRACVFTAKNIYNMVFRFTMSC